MPDIRIDKLAGKALLYDRSSPAHYGVGGVPIRPHVEKTFADQCEKCFTELVDKLKKHAGLTVETILTGGVSRAGQGASLHHQNRAFDLDGLLFTGGGNWVANTFPQRRQLYLGIEAVLRRHFGTVLSYDYNHAHQDHFHFDNGTVPKFKQAAKSHVIFIQNVSTFVYMKPIGRDGVWGPTTERALRELREAAGIGPVSDTANWLAFLDQVAKDAMAQEKGTVGVIEIPPPARCDCCGQLLPAVPG